MADDRREAIKLALFGAMLAANPVSVFEAAAQGKSEQELWPLPQPRPGVPLQLTLPDGANLQVERKETGLYVYNFDPKTDQKSAIADGTHDLGKLGTITTSGGRIVNSEINVTRGGTKGKADWSEHAKIHI